MKKFGLIGLPLEHSFSHKFFSQKFEKEKIDAIYTLYELQDIKQFCELIKKEHLCGLNVTIPYKESIIPFLNKIDDTAKAIGAVNVIKFSNDQLIGYNSDCKGFEKSLLPLLKPHHTKALILGTGGASKAVNYVLQKLNIETKFVSRTQKEDCFIYDDLTKEIIDQFTLIVNTTPLGMFPQTETFPSLPYHYFTKKHLLFDLVYNPTETMFLKYGLQYGCTTKNGYEMLVEQALESWRIWNE